MSLYDETVPQFVKLLGNLETWLDEGIAYAAERDFESVVLLQSRLYADQWSLMRQIQAACDTAKLAGARLAEVEAPLHEDGKATLEELRTRIAEVKAFLLGLDRAAFDGAEQRMLSPSMLQGMSITTTDYVREFALPNFYFHVTTCYAILRTCGVKLGKRAFLGSLNLVQPEV